MPPHIHMLHSRSPPYGSSHDARKASWSSGVSRSTVSACGVCACLLALVSASPLRTICAASLAAGSPVLAASSLSCSASAIGSVIFRR